MRSAFPWRRMPSNSASPAARRQAVCDRPHGWRAPALRSSGSLPSGAAATGHEAWDGWSHCSAARPPGHQLRRDRNRRRAAILPEPCGRPCPSRRRCGPHRPDRAGAIPGPPGHRMRMDRLSAGRPTSRKSLSASCRVQVWAGTIGGFRTPGSSSARANRSSFVSCASPPVMAWSLSQSARRLSANGYLAARG